MFNQHKSLKYTLKKKIYSLITANILEFNQFITVMAFFLGKNELFFMWQCFPKGMFRYVQHPKTSQ